MKTINSVATLFAFQYHNCRNVSSPEDERAGRKVFSGTAPASSVLELEDNENVRAYLVDAKGKKSKQPTLVHLAIRNTLESDTERFSILNSGIVIVARNAEVDDKNKMMKLDKPSIINGSQTQGELGKFYKETYNREDFKEPSIRYEIIVTDDTSLIAEISIARNFQNDVRALSIAGRRGHLDKLEKRMRVKFPGVSLRKNETDQNNAEDILDTEKLIQASFAVMPVEIMRSLTSLKDPNNKVFSYNQKAQCLKMFEKLVESNERYKEIYDCFLDVAPISWELYNRWKKHQGFCGTGIRSIKRDGREIKDVPDGIIFPILSAYSVFIQRTHSGWEMSLPKAFEEKELIQVATQAYQEMANHQPQTMGKSKACYLHLIQVTSIYARLAR